MRTCRRLLVVPVAVALLAQCFLLPREEELLDPPAIEPPVVEYRETAVSRGDIVSGFRVLAYFQPTDERTLSFRYRAGRLKGTYALPGDTVRQGQLLADLEMGDLPSLIEDAKISQEIAEIQRDKARALSADRFEQRITELGVRRAELRLRDLETLQRNLSITAPLDGVVTYRANKYEGDPVDVYYPMYRVADSRKLALVYTGERVGDFRAGMRVSVLYRDVTLQGTVAQAPQSVPETAGEEERKRVLIDLGPLSPPAARGDGAQVEVVLFRKQSVLKLPTQVVKAFQGKSYVNVLSGGMRTTKPVEVGIKTDLEVEILGGLAEGERVLE